MEAILEWPVTKCEGCDFDLREVTPKANEKANDASGRLTWNDFCPKCGYGYPVGDRTLPRPNEEELARRANAPVIDNKPLKGLEEFDPEHQVTSGAAITAIGEASGIPPDERGASLAEDPDPEKQLAEETEVTQPEEKPEPGAIRAPGENEYFCTKCASNHKEASAIGKKHTKNREA